MKPDKTQSKKLSCRAFIIVKNAKTHEINIENGEIISYLSKFYLNLHLGYDKPIIHRRTNVNNLRTNEKPSICHQPTNQTQEQPYHRQEQPCRRQEQPCRRQEQLYHRQEQPCRRREQPCHQQEQPCHRQEQPCRRQEELRPAVSSVQEKRPPPHQRSTT